MDQQKVTDSKRLAKNTLLLYARTLLIMLISLFTSRVILNRLGIDNYGIYNVIGGFVAMFSVVGGTLVTACQRFLTYEIGKKNDTNTQRVFSAALIIHIGLAIVLLMLFESIGLWFLNNKMNIPQGRIVAANWVFQCSILAFLVNIISAPYNALIIAHEKMSAFAYISLLDAILKLVIVYLLCISNYDKLIVYAILLLFVSILNRSIYGLYCKRFPESKFIIVKDFVLYKNISSFASYTFLGSVASILSNHGVNIILNIFYGVAINAARGISVQVQSAVVKFVNDFMTALNPQITKSYAAGDVKNSMNLCIRGAKFSFFLLMIMAIPLLIRTPFILEMWLKIYPDYSVLFVRLSLLLSLITLLSTPLITEILAVGKLQINALAIGGIRLMTLPLCYIIMKFGYAPEYCYCILILIETISLFVRLWILKNQIKFKISDFMKNVLFYVSIVFLISFIVSYVFSSMISHTVMGLIVFSLLSVTFSLLIIYFIGMKKIERQMLNTFIIQKIKK